MIPSTSVQERDDIKSKHAKVVSERHDMYNVARTTGRPKMEIPQTRRYFCYSKRLFVQ
jgi:hypothetical protein